MSKADGLLAAFPRLGFAPNFLEPGWLDVVETALAEHGYYLAPIVPAETTGARTSDPRTSHAAAETITLKSGTQRHRLLQSYWRKWVGDGEDTAVEERGGLTDEEAMEMAEGVSPLSEYATRCSELRRAGWITDTGQDRKGGSGTPRIVCRITAMGRAELRRLEG